MSLTVVRPGPELASDAPSAGGHPAVDGGAEARYCAWFHELDAWTEYWDIFHPESRGRFYFGDGADEPGLLSAFMPGRDRPRPFLTWLELATGRGRYSAFAAAVRDPYVADAVLGVDDLLAGLFARHFGDAADPEVREDYLEAVHRFATDTLPAAPQRLARIPADDPRRRTAGRHTLDGDIMWFCWALHTEAAQLLDPDSEAARRRRPLMLAGVAAGCSADFAWRGHRRTRPEYRADELTAARLRGRGHRWSQDFDAARREVYALYRIREFGTDLT